MATKRSTSLPSVADAAPARATPKVRKLTPRAALRANWFAQRESLTKLRRRCRPVRAKRGVRVVAKARRSQVFVFSGPNVFSVPLEGLGTSQGRQMRLDELLAREYDLGLRCFGHDVPQACTLLGRWRSRCTSCTGHSAAAAGRPRFAHAADKHHALQLPLSLPTTPCRSSTLGPRKFRVKNLPRTPCTPVS